MLKIVGVRFKDVGKIYYFSPGELEITETKVLSLKMHKELNLVKRSLNHATWTKKTSFYHLRKYCVSQQKRIINALLRMATLVRKPFTL